MRTKDTTVTDRSVGLAEAAADTASAQLAIVVSLAPDGAPAVRLGDGPVVHARLAVRASRTRIETAMLLHQQAVVVFENGDRSRPIILGFIEPIDETDETGETSEAAETAVAAPALATGTPVVEADVDGRRVRVSAQDEIVLQCGSASVTLRRNGRVIIRGTYVETHSDGTNRIKGGQVQIN